MSALAFEGVTRRQGSFTLGPIDVVIRPGVTALLGANGAGKTTLMRLVVGITRPSAGCISHGEGVVKSDDVGYLPQDFSGPQGVKVADYLGFIAWCRSRRAVKLGMRDVDRVLDLVDLTDARAERFRNLSGGMVRRVGIAQALLGDAQIIVLDEPTVGLDPLQRRDLRELISRLGESATVLLSTHLSEDVAATADHVMVLDRGTLAFAGPVTDLVARTGESEVSGDTVERGFLSCIDASTSAA